MLHSSKVTFSLFKLDYGNNTVTITTFSGNSVKNETKSKPRRGRCGITCHLQSVMFSL